ncbi:MAG: M48 family metallopeptidase [Xanthomonadales bacterium]|nr:M48 family metallopeptidase [Xanthomonadales bacterium]
MNFFEHQDRARKQTRWLVVAFVLAVLAIVAAIDVILLLALGLTSYEAGEALSATQVIAANAPLLAGGAVASAAVIGLASLFKTASLRSGGGQVARQLGGTLVESDTRDAKRRRLRNVVEEIALASGVPVPEIYVLEQESGINAFAAGFTPSDAAVAVTRGTLEKLDRNELQGVIAHEFSHILNGDMRINIRLMGTLFGILLLALIGRRVLIHSHIAGRSRDKNGAIVLMIAFGLMAVGYVGLFFGRWIKAAVSRQREYLADASAVQFTRDPDGISGALKKIAVYSDASYLDADSEEISHMLFGDGRKMMMFSTHPPLNKRITRVDPQFQPEDLERLAARIQRDQIQARRAEEKRRSESATPEKRMFDAGGIIDGIGQPDWERMLMAASIAASIPDHITQAAHSTEWAPEVLFYTLLDGDRNVREQQLLAVSGKMGGDSEAQVKALFKAAGVPSPEQRLPLLEIAFPALKRRPPDFISRVLDTAQAMIDADGRVDIFEYLLARVIKMHLWESHNPHRVRISGDKKIADYSMEARALLAVLARHGSTGPGSAEAAFAVGLETLGMDPQTPLPDERDWMAVMDSALPRLDRLKSAEKEKLVTAMAGVVLHDGRLDATEMELLRVSSHLIHVPLPLLHVPQ